MSRQWFEDPELIKQTQVINEETAAGVTTTTIQFGRLLVVSVCSPPSKQAVGNFARVLDRIAREHVDQTPSETETVVA